MTLFDLGTAWLALAYQKQQQNKQFQKNSATVWQ